MAQETITIAALSQRTERIAGKFFTVIAATAGFSVELDGRKRRAVGVGSRISDEPFKRISFFETAGAANTITFDAGDEVYEGEVQTTQKVASTYAKGRVFNVTDLTYHQITSGDNGKVRKQIIFTAIETGTTVPTPKIKIMDLNGNYFCILTAGVPLTFETDAAFQASLLIGGGSMKLYVGEIYYAN